MKIRALLVILVMLVGLPVNAAALEVEEATITTLVSERVPVDSIQTYPATVEQLYCFTRVAGAIDDTSIIHVWYRNNAEMARIELPVRSGNWRTWSAKTIFPGSDGNWRVDILDAGGTVLTSVAFVLTK